jgi:hypothetical protein
VENSKLEIINFSFNNLKIIPTQIFVNLKRLKVLDFRNNFCVDIAYPESDLRIIYLMIEANCNENEKSLVKFLLKLSELAIKLKESRENERKVLENYKNVGQGLKNGENLKNIESGSNTSSSENKTEFFVNLLENFENQQNSQNFPHLLKNSKKPQNFDSNFFNFLSNFYQNQNLSQNFTFDQNFNPQTSSNFSLQNSISNIQNKSIENFNKSVETELHRDCNNNRTTNCKESENSSDLDTLLASLLWLIIPIILILTIILVIICYAIYNKYVMYPVRRTRRIF